MLYVLLSLQADSHEEKMVSFEKKFSALRAETVEQVCKAELRRAAKHQELQSENDTTAILTKTATLFEATFQSFVRNV